MRKLLVLGAALVALLSLVSIAQGANGEDESHIWFFGDCNNPYDGTDSSPADSGGGSFFGDGCRGIGIFTGDWDHEGIADEVTNVASRRFGGPWAVEYLKTVNLFAGETQVGSGYLCGGVPFSVESVSPAPSAMGSGSRSSKSIPAT